MIEASVLSPGSWNSDFAVTRDASVEFYRMDVDVGLNLKLTSEEVESYHSVNGSSQSPSIASGSECDDDFNIEVSSDDHNLFNWNDNDYMNTALNDVLEDNIPDQITMSALDWSMCENVPVSVVSEEETSSICCSPPPIRKKNNILDPFISKSWSKLNTRDQVQVVEAVTQVISSELGLREQLEVIRIIEPSALISSNDTEFVIDLNCLTDSKWQAVQEYVKKSRKNRNQIEDKTSVSSEKCSKSRNSNGANGNNSQHLQNSINTKAKQSKKDKEETKAWKTRQKKEYRQMMKERRSGLFVKEEVLALSVCPPPEEEEIDILD